MFFDLSHSLIFIVQNFQLGFTEVAFETFEPDGEWNFFESDIPPTFIFAEFTGVFDGEAVLVDDLDWAGFVAVDLGHPLHFVDGDVVSVPKKVGLVFGQSYDPKFFIGDVVNIEVDIDPVEHTVVYFKLVVIYKDADSVSDTVNIDEADSGPPAVHVPLLEHVSVVVVGDVEDVVLSDYALGEVFAGETDHLVGVSKLAESLG